MLTKDEVQAILRDALFTSCCPQDQYVVIPMTMCFPILHPQRVWMYDQPRTSASFYHRWQYWVSVTRSLQNYTIEGKTSKFKLHVIPSRFPLCKNANNIGLVSYKSKTIDQNLVISATIGEINVKNLPNTVSLLSYRHFPQPISLQYFYCAF